MNNICLFCESVSIIDLFSSSIACVYQCKICKGIFSEPKVNTDELYDERYFKVNYESIENQQAERFVRYVKLIQKYKDHGRALDYGCGTGIFLKVLNEHGYFNNVGVDVSRQALMLAKHNVSEKDYLLHSTEKIKGKFDIISFVDSIAHIFNAQSILKELISSNLNKDGILFIRTPNINRCYVIYTKLLGLFLPKAYMNSVYFAPNRYLLFNKSAMNCFLDRIGMKVLYIKLQKDYLRKVKAYSIKQRIGHFLLKKIPSLLNPLNSMIVIATRR